ncbi:uncharacterized protein At4g17910 isoform X2 [Selaginella moellendorffii]|uniref:uncharacterized protein At4g17910 isoform X2 n=1 Tax=Selaginella moellendorffii TaxID=88036 RepID=UPI000D1CAABA|nr:uncharacterized protein At4g17910 isoform X2 [Selaginella moellendorffii]|eukprot:XP_024526610.1 uncharacterized protein At4g17910 isoform X2 [Selaginella moellendorffii]
MGQLNPNKHLKEEFVSNLQGSSKIEIAALSALIPALVILRSFAILPQKGFWTCLALDFTFIVLPTVLSLTVLADKVYGIALLVSILLGMSSFLPFLEREKLKSSSIPFKRPFLTYYRFVMMLVTCVTILAVDFTAFPRRYAKTETYGTGLMDLGVGSFVAANAIVSRQARSRELLRTRTVDILKSVSPLLALGFVRLIATKGADYQVHVGEYGVHWNFFFTLAAVSLLTSVIRMPVSYCGYLGLGILSVHQFTLLCGLKDYILSPHRSSGLVDLNKEGIFSIFGYWSLYFLSVHLGQHIFFNPGGFLKWIASSSNENSHWLSIAELWLLDGALWLLVVVLDSIVENVSRRTCNMAYVMFVLAQNLEVMAIFASAEAFLSSKLVLVEAVDDNMLLTFLVANVLTGLVNLSMDTIFVLPGLSVVIVVGYMALLVAIVAMFKVYKIRAKFW